MNLTVIEQRAIGAEKSAFHTRPFAAVPVSARSPMLVALWNNDANGRLVQTWVSLSVTEKK